MFLSENDTRGSYGTRSPGGDGAPIPYIVSGRPVPGRRPSIDREASVLAASYPFLDVFWSMVIFFLFVIWIWILITVFADLFRRKDIGGGTKTIWVIFVILLPYLGV